MRITEHNADRLVISGKTQGWLYIVVPLLAGALLVHSFVRGGTTQVLHCTRGARITCQIERSLLGIPLKSEPPFELKGAYLEVTTNSDDPLYQIRVQTGRGDISLGARTSGRRETKRQVVQEIERYLASPYSSTLEVKQDDTFTTLNIILFAVILVGSPLLIGLYNLKTSWILEREQDLLIVRRRSLRGEVQEEHYPLGEITGVMVDINRSSEGEEMHRVELYLTGRRILTLTPFYSSRGRQQKEEIVAAIRAFLRHTHRLSQDPHEQRIPDPLGES